jgi:hypothetical protein
MQREIIDGKFVKNYFENTNVNNIIQFTFLTPLADGTFNFDPYKVDTIKIYFVERNLNAVKNQSTIVQEYDLNLQRRYAEAFQKWSETQNEQDYIDAQNLKYQLDASIVSNQIYYSETDVVFKAGSDSDPIWSRYGDNTNSIINKVTDPVGIIKNGIFRFLWSPDGSVREGEFYLCYTWTPEFGSDTLSDYIHFYVGSDVKNEVTNPSNLVPANKYEQLLDVYTPEMYKLNYAKEDISVETIDNLNKSIAQGFTVLENLALQMEFLMDANVVQEPLLVYLANLFGINLRTNDPTLWRRQIKTAIPKFKRKGTLGALQHALSEANIRLLKFDQLWLTGSDFVFTESLQYTGLNSFELTRVSLSVVDAYFSLEYRTRYDDYSVAPLTNIKITTSNGVSTMVWVGPPLNNGDHIKITYQIKPFENQNQIDIHDYILTLPLADSRNDKYFDYPKKDWNTRLISELDPMFSIIVSTKNPFYNDVKFGKIRTIFPYSENVYNMDEYNGSLRDSTNPCDIDKDFLEPCRSTISPYFDLDVEIDNLSTFRITECINIINEYIPFHATLNNLNFQGTFHDFVLPPEENIKMLLTYRGSEFVIAGMAQVLFNRSMFQGTGINEVLRDALATQTTLETGSTRFFNQYINLFCSDINFERVGITKTASNSLLEILSPNIYAGEYTVTNANKNYIEIVETLPELINDSPFGFRISNITISDTSFVITKSNMYKIFDSAIDFSEYDIKSLWDVANGYASNCWKIKLVSTDATYNILSFVNNIFTLEDDGTLSDVAATGVEFELLNASDEGVVTSTNGNYTVELMAKVTPSVGLGIVNISDFVSASTYFYKDSDSTQYEFYSLDSTDPASFFISGWNSGSGTFSGKILQRVVDNAIGSLSYYGMKVYKPGSWPNFDNPDTTLIDTQNFKENYILVVNDIPYYFIDYTVDSDNCLRIGGDFNNWGTTNTAGTLENYTLLQFDKSSAAFFGYDLYDISRNGQEVINYMVETGSGSFALNLASMSANNNLPIQQQGQDPGISEKVMQSDSITFFIERKDGTSEKGEIK